MLDRDAAAWQRRALDHAGRGDFASADAEVQEGLGAQTADGPAGSVDEALWQGMRALVAGQLGSCERRVAEARALAGPDARSQRHLGWDQVLLAALRREQGRPAEAENVLRAAVDDAAGAPAGVPAGVQAFLALLVAEMGRDTVARGELDRLVAIDPDGPDLLTTAACAEASAVVGLFAEADALYRLLMPSVGRFVLDEAGAVCHGSVSRFLGRLSHVLGRPEEAVAHFDLALSDHVRAGAPLLVAHTSRQLASVLRVWGDDAEWDRSLELLRQAAAIYGRLGVDTLAAEAQAVIARSEDLDLAFADRTRPGVFRRDGDGWVVGLDGVTARVDDAPGLGDIARLLAAPRTSLHVGDLMAGLSARAPGARTDRPWFWPQRPRVTDEGSLGSAVDAGANEAYGFRLAALPAEIAEAEAAGDPLAAALARGEHDVLGAELALLRDPGGDEGPPLSPFERARRVVSVRVRLGLDRLEQAEPATARHLRCALRTGTFCSYEPVAEVNWQL